jgi:hypothetical protein
VAAVTVLTQTGARLIHHGQLTGSRTRLPVFLGRYPVEPADPAISAFYDRLTKALADRTFHQGDWRLVELSGWSGSGYENLAGWCWDGDTRWVIVVNLSDAPATGHVRVPLGDLTDRQWRLVDPTHGIEFERSGQDLVDGLYVQLPAWDWHLLRLDPADGQPLVDPDADL